MDYKKIRPLRSDVLLRLKPAHTNSSSLIIYKEQTDHTSMQTFYVEAVGPEVTLVKAGDVVAMSWKRITPPFEATVDGKICKFGITAEKEIDCIVEA